MHDRPKEGRRRPAVLWPGLLALGLVLAACTGERPELVAPVAEIETDTQTVAEGATGPTPDRGECEVAIGPGPWVLAVGAPEEEPTAPCVALAAHHRLQLVNQGPEAIDVTIGSTVIPIQVGSTQVTEPVGTLVGPGFTPVTSAAATAPGVWLVDPAEDPLAGAMIGLTSVGNIELGQAPVDITEASGGIPVAASGAACNETSLRGDPYSPLFTFRDGLLVVAQVFTPGLLTRSGIGIGSTEADVIAAYGQQIEGSQDPAGNPARKLLAFVPNDVEDQIFRLVFVVDQERVSAIRIGAAEIVATEPGCPTS